METVFNLSTKSRSRNIGMGNYVTLDNIFKASFIHFSYYKAKNTRFWLIQFGRVIGIYIDNI